MPHRIAQRRLRRRISDEANAAWKQRIEMILDQDLELPVDRDERYARVARLLQSLDEQGTIGLAGEDMGVEVVAFDFLGVGEDDLADAERRNLRPEAAHHLGPWHGEQEIDGRSWRCVRFEHKIKQNDISTKLRAKFADSSWDQILQTGEIPADRFGGDFEDIGKGIHVDPSVRNRLYRRGPARSVQQPDAERVAGLNVQDVHEMPGTPAGKCDLAGGVDFRRVHKDEIHVAVSTRRQRYESGRTRGYPPAPGGWLRRCSR